MLSAMWYTLTSLLICFENDGEVIDFNINPFFPQTEERHDWIFNRALQAPSLLREV